MYHFGTPGDKLQLDQLVKPIEEMTSEELISHLREIRKRREITRPAARKIVERAEGKVSRNKLSAAEKLLASLSEDERNQLLQQHLQEPE